MSTQMNLEDYAAAEEAKAEEAKAEAIQQAGDAAPAVWSQVYAVEAAELAAKELPGGFTANDVWQRMKMTPPEPRALGQVMVKLAKAGKIKAAGCPDRPSGNRINHNRKQTVWLKGDQ